MNMFPIYIVLVIMSLTMIIGLLAFFAGRRKGKEGKMFSVLIGLVALLAGGAYEIDKVMSGALLGIAAVLIFINFKRSQRKQPDNASDENMTFPEDQ